MTTISGLTPTSGTDLNYTGAITPDALMAYCASRLRTIDDQMQLQFTRQDQYRKTTSAVNDLQKLFTEAGATAQGINPNDQKNGVANTTEYQGKIAEAFDNAIKSCPRDSETYQQLVAAKADYETGCKDGKYDKDECNAMGERFKTMSADLASNAELDMINLNSAMSQRQTAIQMCTNMVAALGETQKSVAAKIGS